MAEPSNNPDDLQQHAEELRQTEMLSHAGMLWDTFSNFVEQGFSERAALYLTSALATENPLVAPPN